MKTLFFLILVIAIAFFTAPTHQKFGKYLEKKEKAAGKCGTRHYTYKIFTIDYVDYCDSVVKSNITKTDKYLGLFGTFWKL